MASTYRAQCTSWMTMKKTPAWVQEQRLDMLLQRSTINGTSGLGPYCHSAAMRVSLCLTSIMELAEVITTWRTLTLHTHIKTLLNRWRFTHRLFLIVKCTYWHRGVKRVSSVTSSGPLSFSLKPMKFSSCSPYVPLVFYSYLESSLSRCILRRRKKI